MGMYTRFCLQVTFKETLPSDILEVLRCLLSGTNFKEPDHPFFKSDRYWAIARCSSAYHDWINCATICEASHDPNIKWISIVSDLKNYSNEIEMFCDWIAPYVETEELAGYKRYEENDLPTLLFFNNGKSIWKEIILK